VNPCPISDKAVFIGDDDPSVLRSIQRLLKVNGFDAQVFDSVEAFRAFAEPNGALCLVLDVDLKGRSGIELSRQLAASDDSTPIIFMTGSDADHVREEANDAGFLAYLAKPFHAQLLLDAIEKAAALRKSRS
jgi:FixJ family two-component response regulator